MENDEKGCEKTEDDEGEHRGARPVGLIVMTRTLLGLELDAGYSSLGGLPAALKALGTSVRHRS